MKFFYFLKQKKFYLHLSIGILATIFLLWMVLKLLSFFTFHGEAINVPSYSGLTMDEVNKKENKHNFRYIITDSIYDNSSLPSTIVQQNPLPGSKVKRYRKIYFTIVATSPEMVQMPDLVDLSCRQAMVTLKTYGLKINNLLYTPNFAPNAVLAQLLQGDTINPGDTIQKGAKIDLILGLGYDPKKYKVPFLIGKSMDEAVEYLHNTYFNVGEFTYLDQFDPLHSKVYLQEPSFDSDSLMNLGDFISLWFRSDLEFDFEEYIEGLFPDTLALDSLLMEMEMDSLYYEYQLDTILQIRQ